jgi:hypothetical protein
MLNNSSYTSAPSTSASEPTVRANWRSQRCFITSPVFANSLISYSKPHLSPCSCSCPNLSLIDIKAVSGNVFINSISHFFPVVTGLSWASQWKWRSRCRTLFIIWNHILHVLRVLNKYNLIVREM